MLVHNGGWVLFYHLTKRGRTYYFRLRIPNDLLNYFPVSEVRKSLKTSNLPAAKILYSTWEDKFQKSFALLRSGFSTDEQIEGILRELLPSSTGSRSEIKQSLSGLIELYIADRSVQWTSKTKAEFTQSFTTLLSLLSDQLVANITRSDCVKCRELLQVLPPNFTKKKQFRGMTARQIAKTSSGGQSLSGKTVNKYLTLLSSFFKWSIRQGVINSNPAEGLLLSLSKSISEEREVYSLDDIQQIKAKLPRVSTEPEKFWIPLIAMYSGLRLDEICQLHRVDIQLIEGVRCFNINSHGNKRLKTSSSVRVVPIHPELVNLGLLDYVDQLAEGQLWQNLQPDKFGRFGHKFGNWFSRFNRREITDNPRKCFHSFRHTVANQLKQNGISETVIAELIGHKNSNITTGRYGKSYNVELLENAICVIGY